MHEPADLRTIIATLEIRELAEAVAEAIDSRYDHHQLNDDHRSIPEPFRLVHNVQHTTAALANSGPWRLKEHPRKWSYPKYLKQLGFTSVSRSLRCYVRWHFFYSEKQSHQMVEDYLSALDDIQDSVGQYIIDHPEKFEPLLPEIHQTWAYLEHFDEEGLKEKERQSEAAYDTMREITEALRAGRREGKGLQEILEDLLEED